MRLFVRRDAFGRFLSCLVYLPRERFDTENRQRVQDILQEAFGGTSVDYTTRVSESVLARLHVVVYTEQGAIPEYDVGEIEARLAAATRAWTRRPPRRALGAARRGARRPALRALRRGVPRRLPRGLLRPPGGARHRADRAARPGRRPRHEPLRPARVDARSPRVQAAPLGQPILLSDVLPLLENMGVRVSDERPYEVKPADGPPVWIYDFGLRHDEGAEFQADDVRETFQDAFARAWRGEAENDGFNRLVLSAQADRARDHDPARDREVPPPGGQHVQPELHGGRALRAPRRRAPARRALPAPARPGAVRGHGRQGAGARARAGEHDRRGREPRRGPDPARLPARRPRRPADELLPDGRRRPGEGRTSRSSSIPTSCPTCPSRGRCSRSSSTRRASRPCTSAAGGSRAAASAGPTAARTSAPRCSG